MPIITILGLPDRLANSDALKKLVLHDLPEAVAGIPELNLEPKHVTIFAPKDLLSTRLGDNITANIDDLLDKKGRTSTVKVGLARVVKSVLRNFAREHVPECQFIEVSTHSLDRFQEGFDVWRRGVGIRDSLHYHKT